MAERNPGRSGTYDGAEPTAERNLQHLTYGTHGTKHTEPAANGTHGGSHSGTHGG